MFQTSKPTMYQTEKYFSLLPVTTTCITIITLYFPPTHFDSSQCCSHHCTSKLDNSFKNFEVGNVCVHQMAQIGDWATYAENANATPVTRDKK